MAQERIQKVCLLVIFMMISWILSSQTNTLKFKFSNGHIDQDKSTYTIDIEVLSLYENTTLHAMNTRFFYEAADLEFMAFSDFKEGYGFVNEQDRPKIGGKDSAKKMFSLAGKAGYVNQGIALLDVEKANWKKDEWQKLVTVHFKVLKVSNLEALCPSFIWDKNIDQDKGGYLKGSMGTTASTISDLGSEMQCNAADCGFADFNWSKTSYEAPFGLSDKSNCKEASQVSDLESGSIELMQNLPNPFLDQTSIGFSLPTQETVTFSVYSENGILVYDITDTYDRGVHSIKIDGDMPLASGTYLYKIETEEYVSDYKKMIKFE